MTGPNRPTDGVVAYQLLRAGHSAPEVEQVISRSRPFAAAASQLPYCLLLAHRGEHGAADYLIAPDLPAAPKAASALAAALGARAALCDPPDLSPTSVLAAVRAVPSAHPSRNPQAGADPSELATLFSRAAKPGEWVAIALRKPSGAELSRSRRWWAHRLDGAQTHYHRDPAVMVSTWYAGSTSEEEGPSDLRGLVEQVVAATPGLDVETKVHIVGRQGPAGIGLGALGVAAGWAIDAELHHVFLAAEVGAIFGLSGLMVGTGVVKAPGERLAARLHKRGIAAIGAPPRRLAPPRRPGQRKKKDGSTVPTPGDYPLHHRSLIVSPAMVIGLVSPQAGEEADVAVTSMRHVPAALTSPIGPLIGWAGDDGQPVHLDAAAAYAGLGTTGLPGSGKSAILHSLWGWHCLERTHPSGKPGRPGRLNAMVSIEPKPDGVPQWLAYAEAAGDDVLVVSLAGAEAPAIDLFWSPGTDEQRAAAFVEAMVYAWPAGDIQGRSYESLATVFEAVLGFQSELPRVWADLGLPGTVDPVKAAHCLLGGYDDDSAVAMAAALASSSLGPADPRYNSLRKLGPLFGRTVTPSQRRTATESARNKTKVLVEAGDWWSPSRPKLTWDQLLTEHRAVVLATGPTPEHPVPSKLTEHISAMLFFTLRAAVMRTCAGWQAAGESVSIFVDELSVVARSSAEVAAWLRNQGRSYGVRTFFATQYLEQLSEEVRNALLSSETLLAYRQGAGSAPKVAAQISARAEGWSPADLTGLDQHTAVLLTVAGGQPQPPVPVRIGYWDDDPARFAADQGYVLTGLGQAALGPGAADGLPDLWAGRSVAEPAPWTAPEDDWLAPYRGSGA
jgi:hypothetical protein